MGAHLALRLADANQLTLLDTNVTTNSINCTPLVNHPHVRLVAGDVCDAELVRRELADCDIVIHLAALLGVQKVVENARRTMDTIVLGTRNVLEASCQNGPIERVINVSTSEIYGSANVPGESAPASIGAGNDPRMSYSAAKLLGEHLAWSYFRDAGVRIVNVRPFNVYGPLRTTSNAVGVFIVRALCGKDLLVHGHGSQLRSWCYIDDFCDGLVACLTHECAVGEDFNLGNALTTCTIHDLAERIVRLTDSDSQIRFIERPFSDIDVRTPNSDKAARMLAYQPRFGIDQGLRRTIAWHRENLDKFQHWL